MWQDQVLHRACSRGLSNTRQGSVIHDVIPIPPANLPAQSSIRSPRLAGTKMAAKDSSSDAHRSSCCTPSCLEPCTCISSADRTFGMSRYSSCCAHSPLQFRSFRSKMKSKLLTHAAVPLPSPAAKELGFENSNFGNPDNINMGQNAAGSHAEKEDHRCLYFFIGSERSYQIFPPTPPCPRLMIPATKHKCQKLIILRKYIVCTTALQKEKKLGRA
jgi:hypothetical protein